MMRGFVLFVGVAAAALPAALSAQTSGAPSFADIVARLDMADVAFNASIDRIPDKAMVRAGQQVSVSTEGGNGTYTPCFTCHGMHGAGDPAGGFPKLATLPAAYILKRLDDYATAADPNETMSPIAAALSEDQRRDVAVWFSLQPPAFPDAGGEADADLLQLGARLAAIGSDDQAIPACSNCHGPQGTGFPPAVPPLAGQGSAYIVAQLKAYASGSRPADPNNPMPQVAEKMTEHDMEAAGTYFQRLRPSSDLTVPVALELGQNRPMRTSSGGQAGSTAAAAGETPQ